MWESFAFLQAMQSCWYQSVRPSIATSTIFFLQTVWKYFGRRKKDLIDIGGPDGGGSGWWFGQRMPSTRSASTRYA